MHVNNYDNYIKCWIGKENSLKKEFDKLNNLILTSIKIENKNLLLYPHPVEGVPWICDLENFPKCNHGEGKIALCTSGSTGNPKIIEKDFHKILLSKKGDGSYRDVWLLTYNPARWAGMSIYLHCMRHACQLIVPKDLSDKHIKQSLYKVTHISLTPSLFRKLYRHYGEKLKKRKIKQVTFGGEYIDQATINLAKLIWPKARITHVYASTEVGDICSCSDGQEGFPLEKLHYFNLSQNGEAIINGIHTGDLWKIKNDRIIFSGRKDDIINVGGNKISPIIIENLARSFSEIKECKAYGVKNYLLGQVIYFDYIGEIEPEKLYAYFKCHLPKYCVPLKLNKVNSIDLTSANKISR